MTTNYDDDGGYEYDDDGNIDDDDDQWISYDDDHDNADDQHMFCLLQECESKLKSR